jgi:hypothetical protein
MSRSTKNDAMFDRFELAEAEAQLSASDVKDESDDEEEVEAGTLCPVLLIASLPAFLAHACSRVVSS